MSSSDTVFVIQEVMQYLKVKEFEKARLYIKNHLNAMYDTDFLARQQQVHLISKQIWQVRSQRDQLLREIQKLDKMAGSNLNEQMGGFLEQEYDRIIQQLQKKKTRYSKSVSND